MNLLTRRQRIILRVAPKPWPHLCQKLRASRARQLAWERFENLAATSRGHIEPVANTYYLQATDADYKRAIRGKKVR